jgi:uncharacterized membrane protein YcaP (DUF421 family)
VIGAATLLLVNYFGVRFVYRNNKIETLVEGNEDLLILNGKVNAEALKRNMMSLTELEIAAHRQGFASLSEIDRAVLAPEGGVTFIAKEPEPEEARQQELLNRLDQMAAQITALQAALAARYPGASPDQAHD